MSWLLEEQGDDCQLWHGTVSSWGLHPSLPVVHDEHKLKFSRSKNYNVSHKCVSQSGSQHDMVVLDLKPLGFPEIVHSLPSAESELLLSCDSGHTVLSLGKDLAGASFWAALFSCGWVSPQLDAVAGRNEVASDELCFQSYWGLKIWVSL